MRTPPQDRLTVSLRETRVLTERLLLLLDVPKGAVPAIRDLVVQAEALELGGLAFLDTATPWHPPTLVTEQAGHAVVEGHGTPAPYLAPTLLDLGVALLREHGRAEIEVRGTRVPHLLLVLPHAATPYHVHAEVTCGNGPPRISLTESATTKTPAHLTRALHEGIDVDAALWWRLYHRSNDALTEDTPLSRRHAGATLDPSVTDPDTDVDYAGASS
ncbi:hypothetical protein ACWEPC_37015 [Nonomuraea sp. NPDC004297]